MDVRTKGRPHVDGTPRIPVELLHFANQESYTLLLKGVAGSGKTALALGLLKSMERTEEVLYICTRASPSVVVKDHPWLSGEFDVSPKPPRLSDEGELEDIGIFVDGRLDESTTMFERITDALMNSPRPTIVIDSWDSVGDLMDKEAYYNNTKVLQTWRDRARARLILIVEDPDDTTFDYLVDGVVVLRRGTWEGRLVREIQLAKLLGTEIGRPTYYYTLKDSVFRCFRSLSPLALEVTSRARSAEGAARRVPTAPDRFLASGFSELDEALGGGFPSKGTVLLEADPAVDSKIVSLVISRIASAAAAACTPVNLGLFGVVDAAYERRVLHESLPPETFDLISLTTDLGRRTAGYLSLEPTRGDLRARPLEELVGSSLGDSGAANPLVVLSGEIAQDEVDIPMLVKRVGPKSGATIVATHRIESGIAPFPADVRLRLLDRDGTVFFRSDIPWTKLYGVTVLRNGGVPSITLEPVV